MYLCRNIFITKHAKILHSDSGRHRGRRLRQPDAAPSSRPADNRRTPLLRLHGPAKLSPLDRELHPGVAVRRRQTARRNRAERQVGAAGDRPRHGPHPHHRPAEAERVRRGDHPAERGDLPAHLDLEHRPRLRRRHGPRDPFGPLRRRRLGTDHRRRKARPRSTGSTPPPSAARGA